MFAQKNAPVFLRLLIIATMATLAFAATMLSVVACGWLVNFLVPALSFEFATLLSGLTLLALAVLVAGVLSVFSYCVLDGRIASGVYDEEEDDDEDDRESQLLDEVSERLMERFMELSQSPSPKHSRGRRAAARPDSFSSAK